MHIHLVRWCAELKLTKFNIFYISFMNTPSLKTLFTLKEPPTWWVGNWLTHVQLNRARWLLRWYYLLDVISLNENSQHGWKQHNTAQYNCNTYGIGIQLMRIARHLDTTQWAPGFKPRAIMPEHLILRLQYPTVRPNPILVPSFQSSKLTPLTTRGLAGPLLLPRYLLWLYTPEFRQSLDHALLRNVAQLCRTLQYPFVS